MMKKLLTLFVSIILFQSAQAQYFPDTAWTRCYGGSGNDYADHMQATSDGGCIILGRSFSTDGDLSGVFAGFKQWILKLDSLGNIEWQRNAYYNMSMQAQNIRQTTDGGYIIGGAKFTKLKPNGDIDWQINKYSNYVSQMYDGGYALLYNTTALTMAPSELTKLSVVGTTEWTKDLWAVTGGAPEQTPDSSILICGDYFIEGPSFRFAYYEVIDKNGNTTLTKFGGFGGYGGKPTLDNKYILIGAIADEEQGPYYKLLTKRDSNEKWKNEYPDREPADVIQNIDSTYVLCGRDTSNNAFVTKTTSTGNEIITVLFGGSRQDNFKNIERTPNNGYIAFGNTRSTDGTVWGLHDSTDIYVVKWKQDTSIHTPPPVLSIEQTSFKIDAVKVYPTLTNGMVNVLLPQGCEQAKFETYSIIGKAVDSKATGAGNKKSIDISAQPAGQYILTVRIGKEKKSFRITYAP